MNLEAMRDAAFHQCVIMVMLVVFDIKPSWGTVAMAAAVFFVACAIYNRARAKEKQA